MDAGSPRALVAGVAVLAALALQPDSCYGQLRYTGVNLAGADFGEGSLPGTFGVHYTYPTAAEVDYFMGKGMNTFRLPFRWERLQPTLNTPFAAAELARLDAIVNYATDAGAYVVLDPHNYARYFGNLIGGPSVSHASFADFWSRLAIQYKDNDRVIFGLMNEPHSMPTEQWLEAANAAIAAIRATGAGNLILVPGNAWSGAHSWTQNWYGTPNAVAMLNVVDPADNFAYDVHQYLDGDSSGTTSQIVSATVGRDRLVSFTNWLRANGRRGFLGEFAVANSTIGDGPTQIGDEAIHHMLSYIADNDDVWLGWTWWAAGPWWREYRFTLEPIDLGLPTQTDRPAMAVLEPFLVPAEAELPRGDFNGDGSVDAADYTAWRDGLATIFMPSDYNTWKSNFGAAAGSAVGVGSFRQLAVPEPSSMLLLMILAAGLPLVRRGTFTRLPPAAESGSTLKNLPQSRG